MTKIADLLAVGRTYSFEFFPPKSDEATALLEKTIGKRRAGYDEYIRRTNAFFPGPPRPA